MCILALNIHLIVIKYICRVRFPFGMRCICYIGNINLRRLISHGHETEYGLGENPSGYKTYL